MITVVMEPLPVGADEALRKWLREAPLESLKRVVDGKVKKSEVEALTDALQASPGNVKLDASNVKLQTAQKYQHFMDVLAEVIQQQTPYQTAKLT